MALEIIPKKEQEKPPFFPSLLSNIGIFLLAISIISSLIFVFFQWRFSQEIEAIDNLIEERKTAEVVSLETRIEEYHKKTKNFAMLAQDGKPSTPFFSVIEKVVHPGVFLTNLEVNIRESRISASAVARNIIVFDQQLNILKKEPAISLSDIPNFNRREDRSVSFPMSITLSGRAFSEL